MTILQEQQYDGYNSFQQNEVIQNYWINVTHSYIFV